MKLPLPPILGGPAADDARFQTRGLPVRCREFQAELGACEDLGTLEGLLATSKPLLAMIEDESPDWWFGVDTPEQGIKEQIAMKRKELTRETA